MLKGITLSELAARIEANKELKHDLIADTRSAEMRVHTDGKIAVAVADQGEFSVLETAHDQIGNRLAIPSKYYDRMRRDAPDLLATNVNRWFHDKPERRMIRALGGDMRAFLSNRYQRIENEEIAEVALPVLAEVPEIKIVSSEVTDRRMYIQAVTPRIQGQVKRGDVVQAGVIISNSEIGMGSVSVLPLIYRLICLNGMVCPDGLRAYHVGRRIEDNAELWADDTRKADDRAVLLKVRDMVKAALDEVRFNERLGRMQALTDSRVTGDPAKAVEVLAKKVNATEAERGGILRALIQGGDLSAWGMLNAVTHQAHATGSYDRCVELEQAGGALLDLPSSQWREILEAA